MSQDSLTNRQSINLGPWNKAWAYRFSLVLLLGLASCSRPPLGRAQSPTPSIQVIEDQSPVPLAQRPQLSAHETAQRYAAQTRARLEQTTRDPNFNGYHDLVALAGRKNGLVETFRLYQRDGRPALQNVIKGIGDKQKSPLAQDYATISQVIAKPTLAATLEVARYGGQVMIPNSQAFITVVQALAMTPLLEAHNPDLATRLRGCFLALNMSRKVALNAPTVEHYLAGIGLQEATLPELILLIKSGKLNETQLRETISSLQELLGSDEEMLPILDTEYLIASRQLDSQQLPAQVLTQERLGLAARYLKMRPYFSQSQAPSGGYRFHDEVPEQAGCLFAPRQPDYLVALGRSRLAATALGATELLAAIEAHKVNTGAYPKDIASLTPGYLSRIPRDGFAGDGNFLYTKTPGGYRLESVSDGLAGAP